jgi:pimeloyl-ACP methyl ester carboxylesterase
MIEGVRITPVAVLAVTALLAAGCNGGDSSRMDRSTPAGPATADAQVSWEPCPEVPEEALSGLVPAGSVDQFTGGTSYECATVAVPQNWDEPDAGETFDIALVRARSDTQSDRIGSLVINPGGPGGSGMDSAVYLSLDPIYGGLPEQVARRFDIVGFDPRGVGRSDPVECYTDEQLDASFGLDPDPVGDAFAEELARTKRVARACADRYGEALTYFSTRQTAHDMDAIRVAVGDDQMTYLGFSYGTLLGAVYAQLYPEQIRAIVLDGAVDAEEDGIAASEGQAAGFELAFDNFAGWCDGTPAECPLGPDTRATVLDAIDEARTDPVPGADGRAATAGWVFWAVVATLYQQNLWPQLGAAIDQLGGGDPSGVFDLVDGYTGRDAGGEYPNLFDALTAVNCVDDDTEITVEQVRALQDEWRDKYPVFGPSLAVSLLGCAVWPAEPDPYPTGPAEGAPPILVVGTTGDPATPYESTPRLAEMLGVGVVLTNEGEGHTAYPGSSCVDDAVNAYLVDLTVPEDGTTCSGS